MKCEIQWLDSNGQPTPDTNKAIGICWTVAHCFIREDLSVHWVKPSRAYGICKAHAERLKNNTSSMQLWAFESLKRLDVCE